MAAATQRAPKRSTGRRTVQMDPVQLQAQLAPETLDMDERTVEVRWYSGAAIIRGGFFGPPFWLKFKLDETSCRMGRLESGRAPAKDSHFAFSAVETVGTIVEAEIREGANGGPFGWAKIRFAADDRGQKFMERVADGSLSNVSMGTFIYATEEITLENEELRTFLATDWEPFEISWVASGADPDAHVLGVSTPGGASSQVGGDGAASSCEVVFFADAPVPESHLDMPTKKKQTGNAGEPAATSAANAAAERTPAVAPAEPAASSPAPASTAPDEQALAAAREEGSRAEAARAKSIRADCQAAGLAELADGMIEEGLSVDEARNRIFERLSTESDRTGGVSRVEVARGDDEKTADAVENYLLHRQDPDRHKLSDGGRRFVGMSMLECVRVMLTRRGVAHEGISRMRVAKLALHSSDDFPAILENIANKTALQAFEEAPRTYRGIAKRRTIPDFKTVTEARIGQAPSLVKKPEGAQIRLGRISDSKESYALATYATAEKFTREALINDDQDAFAAVPGLNAAAAASLENSLAWAIITGNVVMGDGIALFHASHNNLTTGAISVTSLGAARALMRQQTDFSSGRPLNIEARWLIVPAALETVAQQFTSQNMLADAAGNVNPFASQFNGVIVEPLLDASSAVQWYLAADADRVPTLRYGYLEGEEGPRIEVVREDHTGDLVISVSLDFVAAAVAYVSAVRSSGA